MTSLFEKIFPIFALIALGYILKKRKLFKEGFKEQLNTLIYYFAFPSMLFHETSALDLSAFHKWHYLVIYLIVIILISLILFLPTIRLSRTHAAAFIQSSFRSNLAYLGIPITIGFLGREVTPIVAVPAALGGIANTFVSIFLFKAMLPTKNDSVLKRIGEAFFNPIMIGVFSGFLFSFFELRLPSFLSGTISLFGKMSLPGILLVIGLSVSFESIRQKWLLNILIAFCKLILTPIVGYLVCRIFHIPTIETKVVVLLCAMPTAVAAYVFAKEYGADEAITVSAINFTTLLSVFTIPLVAYFVMEYL